jgi:hypothetical protein
MGQDALRLVALALIILLSGACADREPLRVHETIKDIHGLNGKMVRVAGYLGECGGYDCGLFETKGDYDRLAHIMKIARSGGRPNLSQMPDWLGIASGNSFEVDKKAAPFVHGYVVITGKVNDICRDEQLRHNCTDRAPELMPVAFQRWTPPTGATS